MRLSPSFLRVSSFVSFCCAVTFSTVKPLPDFSFSDSLLMTEPSSLGNLLQVTIATGKAVSFPEAGLTARLCHPIPFNNLTFFSLHLSSSCPVNVMHYYWLLYIEKIFGHYWSHRCTLPVFEEYWLNQINYQRIGSSCSKNLWIWLSFNFCKCCLYVCCVCGSQAFTCMILLISRLFICSCACSTYALWTWS